MTKISQTYISNINLKFKQIDDSLIVYGYLTNVTSYSGWVQIGTLPVNVANQTMYQDANGNYLRLVDNRVMAMPYIVGTFSLFLIAQMK